MKKNTIIILLIILLATILTGNPLVKNENIINIVIGISGIFIIIKNIIIKESKECMLSMNNSTKIISNIGKIKNFQKNLQE